MPLIDFATYFNARKGSTFLITILAPQVTRCSFLALSVSILTFFVAALTLHFFSPLSSSIFVFQRASSSIVIASFTSILCSVLSYSILLKTLVIQCWIASVLLNAPIFGRFWLMLLISSSISFLHLSKCREEIVLCIPPTRVSTLERFPQLQNAL